jgi:hypothetical protein
MAKKTEAEVLAAEMIEWSREQSKRSRKRLMAALAGALTHDMKITIEGDMFIVTSSSARRDIVAAFDDDYNNCTYCLSFDPSHDNMDLIFLEEKLFNLDVGVTE